MLKAMQSNMKLIINLAEAFVLFVMLWDLKMVDCGRSHHVHNEHDHQTMDSKKGIHDPKLASKEHITEHLEDEAQLNFTSMPVEELNFYYFKLHDLNNDTKLDGLEIYKAVLHSFQEEDMDKIMKDNMKDQSSDKTLSAIELEQQKKIAHTRYISDLIDGILKSDDLNNDGYITYPEFVAGRQAANERNENKFED